MDSFTAGLLLGLFIGVMAALAALVVALFIYKTSRAEIEISEQLAKEMVGRLAQCEKIKAVYQEMVVEATSELDVLRDEKLGKWGIPDEI